jgi:peptidoglycan/LPS O-acetylase OafA/YrhL
MPSYLNLVNMNRILLLDSSRAIAALVVVYHHFFSHFPSVFASLKQSSPAIYAFLQMISDLNSEAVMFFFILSGFCIYLSAHRYDFSKRTDVNTYLYKRFKRILPIYITGLAFTFLLGYISNRHGDASFSFTNLLGNLLFLQTSANVSAFWFVPYGENGPLWSISYEMFYYLFFPFFALLARLLFGSAGEERYWYLSLLLALLLSLGGVFSRFIFFTPYGAFLSYFILWYTGVYLAHLYIYRRHNDQLFLLYGLGITSLFVFTYFFPSDTLSKLSNGSIIVLLAYAFYRFKKWRHNKLYRKLENLTNVLFYHLGTGSYAIYILHFPLLLILGGQPVWLVLISLAALLILCIYLETTMGRMKYSFLKLNYLPQMKLKR